MVAGSNPVSPTSVSQTRKLAGQSHNRETRSHRRTYPPGVCSATAVHVEAQLTNRELLPDVVSRLLDRHDQRREAWRQHTTAARDFRAGYKRLTAAAKRTAERTRDLDVDIDGLEL